MTRQQSRQAVTSGTQQQAGAFDGPHSADQFPWWMTSQEATAYTLRKNVRAWYVWRKRHGIIPRNDGRVCKRDIDRAMARPRKPGSGLTDAARRNLAKQWTRGTSHGSTPVVAATPTAPTADPVPSGDLLPPSQSDRAVSA
jgi:hypothetical protein